MILLTAYRKKGEPETYGLAVSPSQISYAKELDEGRTMVHVRAGPEGLKAVVRETPAEIRDLVNEDLLRQALPMLTETEGGTA